MDKFNDGFSDNSYEELLNEYAGESLGNKSVRRPQEKENASSQKRAAASPKRKTDADLKPSAPVRRNAAYPKNTAGGASRRRTGEAVTEAPARRHLSPEQSAPARKSGASHSLDLSKIGQVDEVSDRTARQDTAQFNIRSSMKAESSDRDIYSSPVIEKKYSANAGQESQRRSGQADSSPRHSISKKNIASAFSRISRRKQDAGENADNYYPQQPKKKLTAKELWKFILITVKTNKKEFIIFGCCFIVAGILSAIALSCINDVLAINRTDETVVEVVLPNDADTADAVRVLDEAGLIKNRIFCTIFIKAMESLDGSQQKYLPGVYYFTESMGVEKMIKRFKTSSTRGATISVTIPEGYTIDQIIARLEKNEICTADALYTTIDEVDFSSEYDFIDALEYKENRYHVLEGYLFPATYEFEQGADPATVIRTFLNQFQKRWTEEYSERAAELSMSTDDIIRIASIIEKEAYGEDQFTLVSSVLHNRLNRSLLYPTLDCDSTKVYVTSTIAERVTSAADLNDYILNYSTYECAGLPASAICNPGAAAIEAALYPDTTQYYFFAHDKNKKIYMAQTIEEQEANLRTIATVNAESE